MIFEICFFIIQNIGTGIIKEENTIIWTLASAAPLPGRHSVTITRDIISRELKKEIESAVS